MTYQDHKKLKLDSIRQIAKAMREDETKQLLIFVCSAFDVDIEDVCNKTSKKTDIVTARKMYCYVALEKLGHKQEKSADLFGLPQPHICSYISDIKYMIKHDEHIKRKYDMVMELAKDL